MGRPGHLAGDTDLDVDLAFAGDVDLVRDVLLAAELEALRFVAVIGDIDRDLPLTFVGVVSLGLGVVLRLCSGPRVGRIVVGGLKLVFEEDFAGEPFIGEPDRDLDALVARAGEADSLRRPFVPAVTGDVVRDTIFNRPAGEAD